MAAASFVVRCWTFSADLIHGIIYGIQPENEADPDPPLRQLPTVFCITAKTLPFHIGSMFQTSCTIKIKLWY